MKLVVAASPTYHGRQFLLFVGLCATTLVASGCSKSNSDATSDITEEVIVVSSETQTPDKRQTESVEAKSLNDSNVPQNDGFSSAPQIETVEGPLLRRADDRPDINASRLEQAGIRIERGQYLILLSDLPATETKGLCDLADRLFPVLEQHLGKLPAAKDGSSFQVTGHFIQDPDRFRAIGLMPPETLAFQHGRHVNYQFWMHAPDTSYYRRHLMLHEFIHCFMTCESGMTDIPPLWYIEGMAEYFATHRIAPDGTVKFGVMPRSYDGFEGWGRISEIRRVARIDEEQISRNSSPRIRPFDAVTREFVNTQDDVDYAWWWAACWMLQNHPRYKADFKKLNALKTQQLFVDEWRQLAAKHQHTLGVDWLLFVEALEVGFDAERSCTLETVDGWTPATDTQRTVQVNAAQGWTPTGLTLESGQKLRIRARGRYAMNLPEEDWLCEPAGVSVDYVRNKPLGQLVAVIVSSDSKLITRRISIGPEAVVQAETKGSVWLQINDHSDDRFNNTGDVTVTLYTDQ